MMSLGRLPLPHVNFEPLSSGSLTGERKSSGYFWKTEVQVPMLNVYFCEVQQWLAPKTLHDCHCHPLVVLHISEVAYQVQLSLSEVLPVYSPIHPFNRDSSSRFFQTLLFFQAGGTPEYFVYLKDCDLYLGILTFIIRLTTSHILRLQNSRILRGELHRTETLISEFFEKRQSMAANLRAGNSPTCKCDINNSTQFRLPNKEQKRREGKLRGK